MLLTKKGEVFEVEVDYLGSKQVIVGWPLDHVLDCIVRYKNEQKKLHAKMAKSTKLSRRLKVIRKSGFKTSTSSLSA